MRLCIFSPMLGRPPRSAPLVASPEVHTGASGATRPAAVVAQPHTSSFAFSSNSLLLAASMSLTQPAQTISKLDWALIILNTCSPQAKIPRAAVRHCEHLRDEVDADLGSESRPFRFVAAAFPTSDPTPKTSVYGSSDRCAWGRGRRGSKHCRNATFGATDGTTAPPVSRPAGPGPLVMSSVLHWLSTLPSL